jgi:nucleoside-diphosphate-sugar epimerase
MSAGRILVTGATGFVGRRIVQLAQAAGFEVHAVARRAPPQDAPVAVTWHVLDLMAEETKAAELIATLRPTHLLHAAWCTAHGAYWTSDENLLWLATTARLSHAFIQAGGRRFVMVGTCAEYAWSQHVISEERTPTEPSTLYGACKLAAHYALQALNRSHPDFTAVTGRIFFAYGPYEDAARIVPYICRSLAAGEPALLSSGAQIRDFLHVDDVARGFLTLLQTVATGAVNVASGQPVRLGDIARHIGEASGRGDLIRLGARPDRPDDDHVLVAEVGRLRALGWEPQHSLKDGLSDTYAWWASRLSAMP